MAFPRCLSISRRCWKQNSAQPRTCRLAVVGDKGSGKTSLIYRFSRDQMPSAGEATMSSLETDEMDVIRNGKLIRLTVHDTSGDDDYAKVRALTYSQADGIIICISLDSPSSLTRLQLDWWPEVHYLCPGKPVIVAGTKKDLRDQAKIRHTNGEKAFVTMKQGKRLAKYIGAEVYLECSALDNKIHGKDVKRVFGRAIRDSLKRR